MAAKIMLLFIKPRLTWKAHGLRDLIVEILVCGYRGKAIRLGVVAVT